MTAAHDPVIAALRASLNAEPKNPAVWMHLADLLLAGGRRAEAIDALRNAQQTGAAEPAVTLKLARALREEGTLAEALIRVEAAIERGANAELLAELTRIHLARGDRAGASESLERLRKLDPKFDVAEFSKSVEASTPQAKSPMRAPRPERAERADRAERSESDEPDEPAAIAHQEEATQEDLTSWAAQFTWEELPISFADVAGLDDVKKQIRLRIIAPMQNPEIYRAFGRKGGGGILLYGPPGCGKTFIARATAGECKSNFVVVGIHELLNKWFGETERLIHTIFEEARDKAPTVLFFDEFDALATARNSSDSNFWRAMVDQFLQEMDGVGGDNENVLVFAATNLPWNVDSAFRRPGRFDRMFFVPPPDFEGRALILKNLLGNIPGAKNISIKTLVEKTDLFTGADLKALCERASETALEASLESGDVQEVTATHFERALAEMESSAIEWLTTARNYAKYSNEGGKYDDLLKYLKRIKKW